MIFLCFLFHPLLSFATFSSAYLFCSTPENSNLVWFSLLVLSQVFWNVTSFQWVGVAQYFSVV